MGFYLPWVPFLAQLSFKKTLTSTAQLLMPCVGKIQPRPPAYWLGETLETVPRPNFRPAKR